MIMRSVTQIEILSLIAISVVLSGLLLPSAGELQERALREAASNWLPSHEVTIADQKLLSDRADITGHWFQVAGRGGSGIEITQAEESREYRVAYYAGNCVGGCRWSTTAKRDGARLTLANPVVDVCNKACKSFWIARVGEEDGLVPIPSVERFNSEVAGGGSDWRFSAFTRGSR